MLNHSIKIGLCFGMTSAAITTLGLLVGLNAGTHSKLAVIGGILTIAIADAFSDSLGIHVSEESEGKHTRKEIWQATGSTFGAKFLFGMSFVVPFLAMELQTAVMASVAWGLLILAALSFLMAREQKESAVRSIAEHVGIAVAVILIANYVGAWISSAFA